MKIVQVVPSIGTESSGPSYSVPAMCLGLKNSGCDVSLHFIGSRPKHSFQYKICAHRCCKIPHPALGRSPTMFAALREECRDAQIIHNNSFWMMPNIYPAWAKVGTGCKLVNQPRGTLSKWALGHSRLKKKLIGWIGQFAAMRATDMWVATSEDEYGDIRRLGFRQPVAIVPNGVDLPSVSCAVKKDRTDGGRRMFFLSRIHPKKNLEMLIRCWAKLESQFYDWKLSIVGPDNDNRYADEMKGLAQMLGCKHIVFEGELNGVAKYRFMAESDCEVLPTHSENFGMVVAEALACGTPVICSHGAPWADLITEKCGWWVPTEESAFENAMREAMSMPREVLHAMGVRGREWMRRDFGWDGIGLKLKNAYKWLVIGGDRPEYVQID